MKFRFDLLESPEEDKDKKKAREKLKELCEMMVREAVKRDGFEDMYADLNGKEKKK